MAKGKQGPDPTRIKAKEFKFAQLVLEGVRPEDAAVQVGYSARGSGPRVAAMRLMEKPSIKGYMELERLRRLEQIRKETEVDDIWVTKKFKEILDRCMQPEPVMRYDHEAGELRQVRDEETGQLLFKFDAIGAIKAAENLAKHIGYYELDNNQKRPIIKIGAVQNIVNYFFEDEQPGKENNTIEITEQRD